MENSKESMPLVGGNLQNQPIYESMADTNMPISRWERNNEKLLQRRSSFSTKKHKENLKNRRKLSANIKRLNKRKCSEEAFIHITGTGTILEDSLDNAKDLKAWSKSNSIEADLDDLRPGLGPYEDFHTIDWQKDLARDRNRRRYIIKKMQESKYNFLKGYYDALSGWICVFLIGVVAGCVAACIDIGEGWMKDLKDGVCMGAFYLNKEQCCWTSNQTYLKGDKCKEWHQWHEFIAVNMSETKIYITAYASYVLWSVFFGILTASMVKTLAPYACGSGIPEIKTILSGFIMRGYLGKMTLLVKSVGMIMAVSAGLRLGKEGPLVHAACCIGNIVCYLFPKYGKNEAKKREMLSAASAAGIAIAFNAPIGGVLFSLEEVSYYFPLKTLWRSFFCALVAAFVLGSFNPFGTEHPVKFYLNSKTGWIFVELVPFILLGIFGGIIGAVFNRCNVAWCRFRKTSKLGAYPITEVLIVTVLSALVNFPNIFTKMNGSDLIRLLFEKCGKYESSLLCDYTGNVTSEVFHTVIFERGPGLEISLYLLGLTLITIWVSTIFTFGIKVPSGLFVPSMVMGAVMGRMAGIGMQWLATTFKGFERFFSTCRADRGCLAPELYAMIGAAACLGGVTRMTVSLVVIMFELTGGIDYIMPLMATIVTSKWVGDALYKEGIYNAHILLNNYPFLNNKDEIGTTALAADLIKDRRNTEGPLYCIQKSGMTLKTIENILENTTHIGFPVVTSFQEQSNLVGFVLRRDLKLAIKFLKKTKEGITKDSKTYFTKETTGINTVPTPIFLAKILDVAPITVTVETPMETIVDMFRKIGLRHILITENGKLIDIITKKDILGHIRETSNAI